MTFSTLNKITNVFNLTLTEFLNFKMNQDIRQILANNIKNLRTQKKLSREELSLTLGVDNSYISKLEKGKINITLDKIEMLANYFGIEVYLLLK